MDVVTLGMANAFAKKQSRAQTLVVLGDSLTEQGGEIAANLDTRAYSAWTWGNMLLGQSFSVLANLGIGGQNTAQIQARIGDALALKPGWVHLLCGTNDMGVVGGVAAATTGIDSMLNTFEAAGVRVVLGTIPPRTGGSYTGTQKADTFALNTWIRAQSRTRRNVIVVDYFTALVDSGGNYRALIAGRNPTADGVHLSCTGAFVCGRALADTVGGLIAPQVPYGSPAPGANLLAAAAVRPGGNGAVAPVGWTIASTGAASAVWSDVTRSNGTDSWKQVVLASGLKIQANANASIGSGFAVGDTLNAAVEYQVSGMNVGDTLGNAVILMIRAWNGSAYTDTRYAFNDTNVPAVDKTGVLRVPNFIVPAGCTLVSLFIELWGGMTFRFDKAGLYNRATYAI